MKHAVFTALRLLAKLAAGILAAAAVFALWWALWIFQPAIGVPM